MERPATWSRVAIRRTWLEGAALLEDSGRREAMGIAGRKRVEANFDLRKNVARLVQLYGIDGTTHSGLRVEVGGPLPPMSSAPRSVPFLCSTPTTIDANLARSRVKPPQSRGDSFPVVAYPDVRAVDSREQPV